MEIYISMHVNMQHNHSHIISNANTPMRLKKQTI